MLELVKHLRMTLTLQWLAGLVVHIVIFHFMSTSTILGRGFCADISYYRDHSISETLTCKPSEVEFYHNMYSRSVGYKSGFPPESGRIQGLLFRNRSGVECSHSHH